MILHFLVQIVGALFNSSILPPSQYTDDQELQNLEFLQRIDRELVRIDRRRNNEKNCVLSMGLIICIIFYILLRIAQ